jgi:hypothetical protein
MGGNRRGFHFKADFFYRKDAKNDANIKSFLGVFAVNGLGVSKGILVPLAVQAQFLFDAGRFFERGQKFVHPEVRDHKFAIFKRGRFGLVGKLDHALHVVGAGPDITHVQRNFMQGKKGERVAAPRASALYIEYGFGIHARPEPGASITGGLAAFNRKPRHLYSPGASQFLCSRGAKTHPRRGLSLHGNEFGD